MPRGPLDPDPLDGGEILLHQAFLRALARNLVASAGAEDLVQETCLHVLERAPERPRRLRAWLARVMANLAHDRQRADERRSARELAAPSPAPAVAPSTHELVQRMEVHRRLVELVLALDPAFREVVLLHHFEGLTVAAAAARLHVPLETARTRLRRALAMLRERLERDLGGRDAALAALLPLARLPLPHAAVPTALTAGAAAAGAGAALVGVPLVMTTTTKLALAAASIVTLGGLLLWNLHNEPSSGRASHALESAADRLPAPASSAAPSLEPKAAASAERDSISPPTESTDPLRPISPAFGALRIRTIWQENQLVAPHIHLRTFPVDSEAMFPAARRAQTDERGELLLRDVTPGMTEVVLAGFSPEEGLHSRTVLVSAGQSSELTLELPTILAVAGTVVDGAGKPIEGAQIWLGDSASAFSDGILATTTDREGKFDLPAVGEMHFVAASAPGYAMSNAVHPSSLRFAVRRCMRLELSARGATLRGRVVDPDGKAVADALVMVDLEEGTSRLTEDGSIEERPPPRIARSDADGRFELDGIHAGEADAIVRAAAFPPFGTKLEFEAGGTLERELRLRRGGSFTGIVRDRNGVAVADAKIELYSWLGARAFQLSEQSATTGADGRFTLERLVPGSVTVQVDTIGAGSLRAQIEIPEGRALERDLVVTLGASLRGRVVDERGTPLVHYFVDAEPVVSAPRIPPQVATDADGRFEIRDCGDVDWKLVVHPDSSPHANLLVREPVRPGGDEITLVIDEAHRPTAGFKGTLLDPDGRPLIALVQVFQDGSNSITGFMTHADGQFDWGRCPPGRYVVWAKADGYALLQLGTNELHPGETLDFGELRFAKPASVRIHVDRGEFGKLDAADFSLHRAIDEFDHSIAGTATLNVAGDELLASDLAPGAWLLETRGERLALQQIPLTCKAGETTTVDVRLEEGIRRTLAIRRADGAPLGAELRWVASDASGRELQGRVRPLATATSFDLSLCLLVGDWTLEVTMVDGARGEAAFTVSRRGTDEAIEIVAGR